jgi:uncharacterized protein
MINFDSLRERLMKRYQEQYHGRIEESAHGPDHWHRVEQTGLELAARSNADAEVVRLFAMFHDCCRLNDYEDPEHGRRGADYAGKLRGVAYDLDDARLAQLKEACERHTLGELSEDPTIGTCWDADRLDLVRVGMIPDSRLMSTPLGKEKAESWNSSRPGKNGFDQRLNVAVIGNKAADEAELARKRELVKAMITELEPLVLEFLQCKDLEEYCSNHLGSLATFATAFYDCYQESSGMVSNAFGSAKIIEVFRRLMPLRSALQDPEDIDFWDSLPDPLTIYRGGEAPLGQLARGISWSISEGQAQVFADRQKGGIVVTGSISKEQIFAVFGSEQEVVVEPKSVSDIQILPP